jgi:hypothetical protein
VVGNWITFSSRFVGAIVFAIVFGGLVYIGYGNESMSVQRTPSFWRVEGKAHRRLFPVSQHALQCTRSCVLRG